MSFSIKWKVKYFDITLGLSHLFIQTVLFPGKMCKFKYEIKHILFNIIPSYRSIHLEKRNIRNSRY